VHGQLGGERGPGTELLRDGAGDDGGEANGW
jgi:hypothetical protein